MSVYRFSSRRLALLMVVACFVVLSTFWFDRGASAAPVQQQATGLVITGVIDGPLSGGLPKAIELYALSDIPDLSIYGVGSANNGGGSNGEEFSFPAASSATEGEFIYVASESTGFSDFIGFAPDYTSNAANINGDDAIELFMNGAVVDIFGEIDVGGTGTPWEYLDGWTYRNDCTDPDGTTFDLDNWHFSGINALDGESSNATAAVPFPIGTYTPTTDPECSAAATIALFEATPQPDGIQLTWITVAEPDTQGFNLYRATDPAAPEEQLNEALIEAQGMGNGATYAWLDESARVGVPYFYWLEDVDFDGSAVQHGPISATLLPPSAVTLTAMDAGRASALRGVLAAAALLTLGAAFALRRRAA